MPSQRTWFRASFYGFWDVLSLWHYYLELFGVWSDNDAFLADFWLETSWHVWTFYWMQRKGELATSFKRSNDVFNRNHESFEVWRYYLLKIRQKAGYVPGKRLLLILFHNVHVFCAQILEYRNRRMSISAIKLWPIPWWILITNVSRYCHIW